MTERERRSLMFKVLKEEDCHPRQEQCDLSQCLDKSCFECGAQAQARKDAERLLERLNNYYIEPSVIRITPEEYAALKRIAEQK